MSVAFQEADWKDSAGRSLHYYCWKPAPARALLVIVHGFGEHAGRYRPVAEWLAGAGICVAAPDLPGHGRSEGSRGDLADLEGCVCELARMTQERLLPESGQQGYAVFGHSFGGLLAAMWAMQAPPGLRRAAIQAPLIDVGFPVPRWKERVAAWLAQVAPGMTLDMGLDLKALSRNPEIGRAYKDDRLVHSRMSARAYQAILKSRDEVVAHPERIRVPVLFLQGGADRIVSVAAAQRWYESLTCEKHQAFFPDCYHELHHETARDDMLRLVRDWVLDAS